MQIDVLTLFPEYFRGSLETSLFGKAIETGRVRVGLHDIREFGEGRHRSVDDTPYGGGSGMVMAPGPLARSIERVTEGRDPAPLVVLLTPQGQPFDQATARRYAELDQLVLVCGRYEGIDERIRQHWVDEQLSVGDYVLSGGEPAAVIVMDSVVRLLPGVMGNQQSADEESFSDGLLEYPHYTRPPDFEGFEVPEVLLSGHHEQIRRWRRQQALIRTQKRRPDLLRDRRLTNEDLTLLAEAGE